MQICELTLKNFRTHTNKKLAFHPKINGIVGANGTGKSSILEAIQYSLIGEGYSLKDDLIKVGSIGPSYIVCYFSLNGKEGYIERHIDSSKVILNFNNAVYRKSSEIKELWEELFQIDKHIFKHIIIAKQNKITELLSGESTIREKSFQKIFRVPNTEKIRSIIWEKYIRTAPPKLLEEEIIPIENDIKKITFKLNGVLCKLTKTKSSLLSEDHLVKILKDIDYYTKCLEDQKLLPKLTDQLRSLISQRDTLQKDLQELELNIAKIQNINELEIKYNQLTTFVKLRELKQKKLSEASNLCKEYINTDKENQLHISIDHHTQEFNSINSRLEFMESEITASQERYHIFTHNSSGSCPTCNQPIVNLEKYLHDLDTRIRLLKDEQVDLKDASLKLQQLISSEKREYESVLEATIKVSNLLSELEDLDKTPVNECELAQITLDIQKYKIFKDKWNTLRIRQQQLQGEINLTENKLSNLCKYDGVISLTDQLTASNKQLSINMSRKELFLEYQKEALELEGELRSLKSRVDQTNKNKQINSRNTIYLNKLKYMYDFLHTTNFPRKLVQSYAGDIGVMLNDYIKKFNFPYSASIADGFKIDMYDSNEKYVPALSGGQLQILGLCLRFALYSFFAQSFPLLIIDEGTTNLDVDNAQLYFNCVNTIKVQNLVQQFIIVDHNPALADSVDHVIAL